MILSRHDSAAHHCLRLRANNPTPTPTKANAPTDGSGTVISKPQLCKTPSPPEETSETYKVQSPFGSIPLKPFNIRVRAVLSKTEPADSGSIARPSGCHCPVN